MSSNYTDRWLLKPDLKARIPLSLSSIERGVREGWFPAPVKIGPRRIAWRESTIAAWEESRVTSTTEVKSVAA